VTDKDTLVVDVSSGEDMLQVLTADYVAPFTIHEYDKFGFDVCSTPFKNTFYVSTIVCGVLEFNIES